MKNQSHVRQIQWGNELHGTEMGSGGAEPALDREREVTMPENADSSDPPSSNKALWMAIVGALCLVGGLIFLMMLILGSLDGQVVPCSQRYLVGAVLGLLLAVGSAFLGASGAIKGSLPIPALNEHPVTFSLVGGAAVFLIVYLVVQLTASCDGDRVLRIDSVELKREEGTLLVLVDFESSTLSAGETLHVSVGDGTTEWLKQRPIDPSVGRAILALAERVAETVCVQLEVRRGHEILGRTRPVCA